MKELIGFETLKNSLEKKYGFTEVSNTADNFRMLINEAKTFNDQNEDYIAFPATYQGLRDACRFRQGRQFCQRSTSVQ